MEVELINIVSFGGGTNSAAMLVGLHQHGIPVDLILFADTGAEQPHTYCFIETMNEWLAAHNMPSIITVENLISIRCSADTSGKRCCPQTGSYARILQPRRTPARNVSYAASPFPPAATVQNTVTAVRPMLPGAMQPSASAASGQRRGASRFRGFKSLAAGGFPDALLEYAGYSYGNCEKRL